MQTHKLRQATNFIYLIDKRGTIIFTNDHEQETVKLLKVFEKHILEKQEKKTFLLKQWWIFVYPVNLENHPCILVHFCPHLTYHQLLEQPSFKDEATSLYNRNLWEKLCSLESQGLTLNGYGIIMIDIDNLKTINDEMGHVTGDQAIRIVAHAIRDAIRQEDMAFRYGGDEFLIALPDVTSRNSLEEIIQQIRENIYKREYKMPFTVQVSIGAAYSQGAGQGIKGIITKADQEMYQEKYEKRTRLNLERTNQNQQERKNHLKNLYDEVAALAENQTTTQSQINQILRKIENIKDFGEA